MSILAALKLFDTFSELHLIYLNLALGDEHL